MVGLRYSYGKKHFMLKRLMPPAKCEPIQPGSFCRSRCGWWTYRFTVPSSWCSNKSSLHSLLVLPVPYMTQKVIVQTLRGHPLLPLPAHRLIHSNAIFGAKFHIIITGQSPYSVGNQIKMIDSSFKEMSMNHFIPIPTAMLSLSQWWFAVPSLLCIRDW